MTIHRPITVDGSRAVVAITTPDGRSYRHALEDRDYDDQDPVDAEIIRAHPGQFDAPNVEQATRSPGEKRTTRKPKPKK